MINMFSVFFFFLLTFRENCSSVQTVQVEDRPACAALRTQRGEERQKKKRISSFYFTQ